MTWRSRTGEYSIGDFTRGLKTSTIVLFLDYDALGEYTAAIIKWLNDSDSRDTSYNADRDRHPTRSSFISSFQSIGKSRSGSFFGSQPSLQDFATGKSNPVELLKDLKEVNENVPKKEGDIQVSRLQEYFRDTMTRIIHDKAIYPEQLDIIWVVLKELSAEQSSEVLVPIIIACIENASQSSQLTSDPEAYDTISMIVDTFLSGAKLTKDQRGWLCMEAKKVSREDLLQIVVQGLVNCWKLKADIDKAREKSLQTLLTAFIESLRVFIVCYGNEENETIDSRSTGTGTGTGAGTSTAGEEEEFFVLLLAAGQFLPQATVMQILHQECQHTTWITLFRTFSSSCSTVPQIEEFVQLLHHRDIKSLGWRPPTKSSTSSSSSSSAANANNAINRSNSSFFGLQRTASWSDHRESEYERDVVERDQSSHVDDENELDNDNNDKFYAFAETGLILDFWEELQQQQQHRHQRQGEGKEDYKNNNDELLFGKTSFKSSAHVELENALHIVRTVLTPLPFE